LKSLNKPGVKFANFCHALRANFVYPVPRIRLNLYKYSIVVSLNEQMSAAQILLDLEWLGANPLRPETAAY